MLKRVQHDGVYDGDVGRGPASSENRERPFGEDQREGAAGDDRHAQPVGRNLANRSSGEGERVGHVAGVRPQLLPKR